MLAGAKHKHYAVEAFYPPLESTVFGLQEEAEVPRGSPLQASWNPGKLTWNRQCQVPLDLTPV